MTKAEYEQIKESLLKKLHKGNCITNRQDGYNEGILCAISKVRDVYKHSEQE